MVRKLLIALCPIALWATLSAETMYSTGIAGRTGSPGETNCTSCHTGFALNSSGGSITLQNPAMSGNVYTPGQTYSMSVTVARTGFNLFGFAVEALTASNQNAGTLNITDPASTQIKTAAILGVSRRNVVHTSGGGAGSGTKTFNFSWTAPSVGTGTVTFYFAGNAANGNTFSSGDYIYTGSLTLTEGACTTPSTPASITGVTSSCAGASSQFSVVPDPSATGYTWTLPSGWSGSSTTNSITVTAGGTSGNITVTANNACGSSAAQSLAVSGTAINASASFSDVTCAGADNGTAQITVAGGNGPYAYQWSPPVSSSSTASGLAPGTYTVTVTDFGGCTGSRTFTITQPSPLFSNIGSSRSVCEGTSVTLGNTPVVTGGTQPYVYLWVSGSGTSYTTANPVYTATTTTPWQLTVTDANGCTSNGTVNITVNPSPATPVITFVSDTLVASAASGLQWYLNGAPISGATGPTYFPLSNGDYTVSVSDPVSGCSSTSAVFTYVSTRIPASEETPSITVYPMPASDHVIIGNSTLRDRKLVITDATGRIVVNTVLKEAALELTVSDWTPGVYSVVMTGDRGLLVRRLLIQH